MSYDERLDPKSSFYRGWKASVMSMALFMKDNGVDEGFVTEFVRNFTATRAIQQYKMSKPELRRKMWTVIDGGKDGMATD